MFFVGIMGIGNKEKTITEIPGITCKACGGYGRYTVYKRYQYFHLFFIPLWKWKVEYYVTERTCHSVFRLKDEAGVEIEKGVRNEIFLGELIELNVVRKCKNCGHMLDNHFMYCPYCGQSQ